MTVLVTGAAGFLGANLVRRLAKETSVVALVREPPDADLLRFLGSAAVNVSFVVRDVRDREGMHTLVRDMAVERIIHAAAVTPTPEQERTDPAQVIDINLGGTVNILEAARRNAISRVVYISSDGVYGAPHDTTGPVDETTTTHPTSLYTIGKLTAEHMCKRYADLFDLSIVSGRLGALYGPMERVTEARSRLSIICHLMHRAIAGRAVTVSGLDHQRDWIYATDAAEAYARLLFCETPTQAVYNVGTGTASTLRDILAIIQHLEPSWRWYDCTDLAGADFGMTFAQARAPLDITHLTVDTGFTPTYTLPEGLCAYHETRLLLAS